MGRWLCIESPSRKSAIIQRKLHNSRFVRHGSLSTSESRPRFSPLYTDIIGGMLNLLEGRGTYWTLRLHFGLLLLVCGELVGWQNATTYQALDWLAIALIYLALGAALLDFIVRLRVNGWLTLLLVGGIFGVAQGTLISLAAAEVDIIVTGLLLRALGVGSLMFILAFALYRLLLSGEQATIREGMIAALIGIGWGIWTRWFANLERVNVVAPQFSDSMPYVLIALAIVGVLPVIFFLRLSRPLVHMSDADWMLTPYEWVPVVIVLGITLILRGSLIEPISVGIAITILVMIGMMLFFTRETRKGSVLDPITPPHIPLLIGWFALLVPFALGALAGYNLSGTGDESILANVYFGALTLYGAIWLPLISIVLGFRIITEMAREGY